MKAFRLAGKAVRNRGLVCGRLLCKFFFVWLPRLSVGLLKLWKSSAFDTRLMLLACLGVFWAIWATPDPWRDEIAFRIDAERARAVFANEATRRASIRTQRIVAINFDEAAAKRFGMAPPLTAIPLGALVDVIERLRDPLVPKPAAVFLDVSILEHGPSVDRTKLARALKAWADDPRTPMMGIYPRLNCPKSRIDVDVSAFPAVAIASRTGSIGSGRKILWSCPAFDDLSLSERLWTCVTRNDGLATTVAIPSPSWLAEEARLRQAGSPGRLDQRLRTATRDCRAGIGAQLEQNRRIPVPKKDEFLEQRSNSEAANGIFAVSAADLLIRPPPSQISGAIVVIGGNYYSPHTFADFGIEGGQLVGIAMRDAYLFDLEQRIPILGELTIAWVIILSAYGVRRLAEKGNERLKGKRTFWAKSLRVCLGHESLYMALLVFVFVLILSRFASAPYAFVLAVTLSMTAIFLGLCGSRKALEHET